MIDQLFTVNEIAARLRVTPETVRAEVRSGRMRSRRLGARTIRITEAMLDEWLTNREQSHRPESA